MQNYETIRQRMLTSELGIGDYFEGLKLKKQTAVEDNKLTGYGFLAGLAA